MNSLSELKGRVSALTNEDLFKMVNEDIVSYEKEEITLAYEEMERRGLLTSTDERQPLISPVGWLVGLLVLIVESVLIHPGLLVDKDILPWPRAFALAAFVALIAGFWERTKFSKSFWRHLLWSLGLVLLGSLALWDLPNLLRQRIPVILAFGIPAALFAVLLFWLYEFYLPRARQKD